MCGRKAFFSSVNRWCLALGIVICPSLSWAVAPGLLNLQGKLTDNLGDVVPNGSYGVTFRIYDNAAGGAVLWSEVTTVSTINGVFTKLLGTVTPVPDTVFRGTNRWLGIQITGEGELFPRTQLSAVGWAQESAQWNSVGPNLSRPTGKVGIGTAAPAVPLHVVNDLEPVIVIQDDGPNSTQAGYIGFWNSNPTETGWLGYGTPGSPNFSIVNSRVGGQVQLLTEGGALYLDSAGRVGMGTSAPSTRLEVNGTAACSQFKVGVFGAGGTELARFQNPTSFNWGTIIGAYTQAGAQVFRVENDGDVMVAGNLTKGGGSFKIDHPLDPAHKSLSHSFVESPDMMNIYNGNVVTDAHGNATVTMPEWFGALNRDFRYQLTVLGEFAQAIVSEKMADNRFSIKTDKPGIEVSWQVTGIRQDAYANAHRIPVEELKPEDERGTFIHPEVFPPLRVEKGTWARRLEPARPGDGQP